MPGTLHTRMQLRLLPKVACPNNQESLDVMQFWQMGKACRAFTSASCKQDAALGLQGYLRSCQCYEKGNTSCRAGGWTFEFRPLTILGRQPAPPLRNHGHTAQKGFASQVKGLVAWYCLQGRSRKWWRMEIKRDLATLQVRGARLEMTVRSNYNKLFPPLRVESGTGE